VRLRPMAGADQQRVVSKREMEMGNLGNLRVAVHRAPSGSMEPMTRVVPGVPRHVTGEESGGNLGNLGTQYQFLLDGLPCRGHHWVMARSARAPPRGVPYHVMGRGVRLMDVLFTVGDCVEYLRLMAADYGDGRLACTLSSGRPNASSAAVSDPAPPADQARTRNRYCVPRFTRRRYCDWGRPAIKSSGAAIGGTPNRCLGYPAQRPTSDLTGLLIDVPRFLVWTSRSRLVRSAAVSWRFEMHISANQLPGWLKVHRGILMWGTPCWSP